MKLTHFFVGALCLTLVSCEACNESEPEVVPEIRWANDVTVFEKDNRIGGLLVYGIPDFKLDKKVVTRRVEQLRAEGIKFQTGVHVGVDYSVKELRNSFDAILLATGAQNARKLMVEGSDLEGVHYAMHYLPQRNCEVAGDSISEDQKIESGNKKAVILGGGFTAADCLGNLNRQGANPNIHQFELVDMVPRPTPVHKEVNPDCRANILTEKIGNLCSWSNDYAACSGVRV